MERENSILDKLDSVVPAPLADFDAFPKLPSSYKARSESRGFMTIFVCFMAWLLMLNDIGEFIWGWPDYRFEVDRDPSSFMDVNVDMIVNMPCKFLSVDLRDAVGDRLFLSGGLRRDGTLFDIGQATTLKEHTEMLSAQQAVAQSRRSRGLFDTILRRKTDGFRPTYYHEADASACRIYGSLEVKKVTANLHITTLGHGYASYEHVDHNSMNLSHIITEFSFGPFFPDMTQPLDYSYEVTDQHFIAYQYFLHVVPTTYIAPRSYPLFTNQYSVTHYTRELEHDRGTPGIFFKFDLDPLSITIHQRTTTLIQLIIRCVGVIGGVFVCMGYAIRITTRAVEVVTGADQSPGLVAAEASGAKAGLRAKWGGSQIRSRPAARSSWAEGGSSPYTSYAGTPVSGAFGSPAFPSAGSPYLNSPSFGSPSQYPGSPPVGTPGSPAPGSAVGLGFPASAYGPPPASPMRQNVPPPPRTPSSAFGPPLSARTPSSGSAHGPTSGFPPTPNPANGNGHGFPHSASPTATSPKKDD
ncbi:hypothetical protein HGRIS_000819 [Hohenbuehelia grisea]|uniref:DUF1692-domain-containing protein n=1 Tax=Hohenbuehelia grisea TaxID=104357 RepID=A0ABR3IPT8_9AGAR